jgi:hypothetical protein
LQKGSEQPVTLPKAVEQPEILAPERPGEPIPPPIEPPAIQEKPNFENEPGKAAIPKFI